MLAWGLGIWGFGCVFQGFIGDRVLCRQMNIYLAMYKYIPVPGYLAL